MGKLGKKARKFAKKNLQSVLKRKRQINSMILKKYAKQKGGRGGGGGGAEDHVKAAPVPSNERIFEDVGDTSLDLDLIFSEDDSDMEDGSESDGFLPEDPDCAYNIGSERDNDSGKDGSTLLEQNKDIQQELAKEKKRLERLREKDPDIIKFLEEKRLEQIKSESDGEEEMSDEDIWDADEDGSNLLKEKLFTVSAIDSWKKEVMEEQKYSALPNLLNAYRSVCHYGTEDDVDAFSSHRVQSSDTFCNIALFMLQESDGIFRKLLVLGSSNNKVETILGLKTSAKWKNAEPLIKSYLSSTLFLLNHVSDSEILVFSLTRLKASVVFFAAFPSLLRKFIKVAVYLWSTGVGPVSSSAFLVVQNISLINSNCLDTCLVKAYKAFISHCKVVEPSNLTHLQFLLDSLVKLYSLDVPNSFNKAQKSIQQLARILQRGIKTKKKEVLKRIYNWQYTNCIDLWVKFISANIKDHDLQSLLYVLIQVINGVAHLFPGPRYLPLRLKCIQMINQLSSSTGLFVPVTSLVLDCLDSIETTKPKPDERLVNDFNVSAVLKVPKQWLKVKYFQEELVKQVIELLAAHFSQWCLHITFPDLATFPLIRLRTFYEKLSTENLRRPVKRLIDQVQQNIEFVQKKRDEAAFSPKDLDSIETFVQVNRSGGNLPFVQYYENIVKKPAPLSMLKKKTSDTKVKKTVVGDAQKGSGKVKRKSPIDGSKRKKQKKTCMRQTAIEVINL